ncbi:MAG TPA: TonB-dependent receptor [Steroidobacteraceae bacterium]|nr:TonB-dependent receptor [Steroidobacteraceae bacterium]
MARRPGAARCIAAAVAGILYGSLAHAADQDQAAQATAPGATDSLQEVVVTANAQQGVKKLDASYNIVAVDAEQIKEANPKSTADLLKVSPGIWPESSGGQTGANIEVAGFPSGGDAPFFTNMIEGLPMFGMPSLSFMDSSSMFRIDDTIDRLEVVQGGPGALFGPAQMGATANFILKRGTDTPTGDVAVTYGNEGLWRVDGFYGGPVADGWKASLGGFYVSNDGIRSPQFPEDVGGQFTATLSKDLDGGSVLFWTRVLDEKDQFMVPIPVIESANGNISQYPGFCALACSYGSYAIQNVTVPNPAGGFEGANLANGRGTQFYYFGSKWEQKIDAWQFSNNFMIDGGGLDTNALFSGPNPRPLSYYLYGCQMAAPAGYCNGATAVDTNNLGPGGQGLPVGTVNATYATTGNAVPLGQSVITQGWWFIQKSLQSITDEFRASREIFDGNTLTGGVYLARYSDNDNWSLGNQMLMTNTPNATPISLTQTTPGGTVYLTSPQGFVNENGNYNILAHGDAMNIAGYFSDSWKVDAWLIDVGARLENIDVHQRTCNTTPQQLGTAADLYDNAVPVCNGTYDYEHYQRTRPTFTGGINYEFTNSMSAYVRINNGVHYDDFDNNIRGANGNYAPLETVQNYEGGFKFQNQYAYLDLSIYQRDFTGLQYTPSTNTGVPITGETLIYGASTHGLDFVASVTPLTGLNIRVVGDYMDGHYTDYTGCIPYTDILGNPQCGSIDGAPLQRQPKWQFRVTPSYAVPASWGDITGFVTYEYVGQRYEDLAGLQPLGTYYMLGAGLIADVGNNWQFRIQGTNLTNQIGLTEGNARIFGSAVGLGGVLLARPIEGREVNFTVKYKF